MRCFVVIGRITKGRARTHLNTGKGEKDARNISALPRTEVKWKNDEKDRAGGLTFRYISAGTHRQKIKYLSLRNEL